MRKIGSKSAARLAVAVAACGVALFSVPVAEAAALTGFAQTDAGPYDYNIPANWVGSDINGTWDASLALTAAQTVTFGADTTLSTGLSFAYSNTQQLTFRADGLANRTITVGADVLVSTVSASRTVTIGSGTANQGLNIDLGGGSRIFDVRGTAGSGNQRTLAISNAISNGSLTLQGGGNINLLPSALTTHSLSALTLKNAVLGVNNNKAIVNVSGALSIDGAGGTNGSGNSGGIGILSLASGAAVSANSLSRVNGGVAVFRGTSLGAGSTAIKFTTAPALVGGGGAAGSTNISIVPWILGGTTTALTDTFVTYDSTNGVRPLDPSTEFVNYAGGYSGVISGTDNNIKVADGTTVEFTGNNTVNSLSVNYNGSAATGTIINGGTITVSSGAVSLVSRQGATLNANLDFGTAQGVIGYTQGKNNTIAGTIGGSGGLVLYQPQPHALLGSGGTGVAMNGNAANSTYTGDTYILGRANIAAGVLPSGSRTGNVYVSGILETNGGTINGLNGAGLITKATSGSGTLTVGDNDASGNFSGTIGGALGLTKIGAGTQTLGGTNTYTGATTITGGTLALGAAGSIASSSSVDIAAGATFDTTAQSFAMSGSQTVKFELDPTGAGSAGLLQAGGLDITNSAVDFGTLGALDDAVYVLATYTSGLLTGTQFASVSNQPAGYSLDYSYNGNSIALTVPEPATIGLAAGVMLMGLLRRQRRQRRSIA